MAKKSTRDQGTWQPSLTQEDARYLALLGEELNAAQKDADMSREEIRAMVFRLLVVGRIQRAERDLIEQVAENSPPFPEVSSASIKQALRRDENRRALLQNDHFTYQTLAEVRRSTEETVRQWIRRGRNANRLFTVSYRGQTVIPAIVLDKNLDQRDDMVDSLTALKGAGLDGWSMWSWWTLASPWFDGLVPLDVLTSDPQRVIDTARRWSSNVA